MSAGATLPQLSGDDVRAIVKAVADLELEARRAGQARLELCGLAVAVRASDRSRLGRPVRALRWTVDGAHQDRAGVTGALMHACRERGGLR